MTPPASLSASTAPAFNRPRVLLVEDDAAITDLLRLHLVDEQYEVECCSTGVAGLQALGRAGWDLLILDLMLPGVDGLEICRQARTQSRYTPIIILSARDSEVHRVLGLELGADDYIAKPFSVIEVMARVRALLRRAQAMASDAQSRSGLITAGNLTLDPVAHQARLAGRVLDLTPREFELLAHFARHPERVFSRLELLDAVWGYQHDGYEHTVNTHINRLRAKIEPEPARPCRILTVWGRGYRFAASAGPAGAGTAGAGPAGAGPAGAGPAGAGPAGAGTGGSAASGGNGAANADDAGPGVCDGRAGAHNGSRPESGR